MKNTSPYSFVWMLLGVIFLLLFAILGTLFWGSRPWKTPTSEPVNITKTLTERALHPRIRDLAFWQRPEGPIKIGIQVGHWQASEAPDEQEGLRKSTGTSYGTLTEWETMLTIAEKTKILLEKEGYQVELLPVTIPPNYWADIFISLHADGNEDSSISGYKISAPRFDYGEKSERLATLLTEEYGKVVPLPRDTELTREMRGYYAFNWFRYTHSIHPLTSASIIETGFLSHQRDRNLLVQNPETIALGISKGIIRFVQEEAMSQQSR